MKLLEGKRGLIFGLANQRSIAWGISECCHKEGARLAFTYLNESLERRVRPLAESLEAELILPCDVQNSDQIEQVFKDVEQHWGGIDFLVHSIAYAPAPDLEGRFVDTSREGFGVALQVSAYSLIALVQKAHRLMSSGGSIITLTYYGSTKVIPQYKVMGVAKAALEATVRELAIDLGKEGIRVNAISAGPIRTLASSGISNFKELFGSFIERAPLKRNTSIEDVGASAVYLLSDLASAVTGEIHFVVCGFNATA